MTINKRAVIEYVLLLLIIVLFLLILPGLATAAGSVLLIYIDGIQDFSPVASRLAFAAVGMMVVSLIGAKILKVERSFLKVPVILTLTGIVLIPLEAGLTKAFSALEAASSLSQSLTLHADAIAHALLTIAPPALLGIAIFLMGGELVDLVWQKRRSGSR